MESQLKLERDVLKSDVKRLFKEGNELVGDLIKTKNEKAKLQAELEKTEAARKRFCSAVNDIANIMGHTDKQCYAPEAVIRWIEQLQAENTDLKENMTKHALNYRKGRIKQLEEHLKHVDTCLSILANTKSEEWLIDLPKVITRLKKYVRQALKEKNGS